MKYPDEHIEAEATLYLKSKDGEIVFRAKIPRLEAVCAVSASDKRGLKMVSSTYDYIVVGGRCWRRR